jgi:hypothetical protein
MQASTPPRRVVIAGAGHLPVLETSAAATAVVAACP